MASDMGLELHAIRTQMLHTLRQVTQRVAEHMNQGLHAMPPPHQSAALQENLTAANAAAQAVGNDDGGQTPLTGGSDNAVKVPLSPFGLASDMP